MRLRVYKDLFLAVLAVLHAGACAPDNEGVDLTSFGLFDPYDNLHVEANLIPTDGTFLHRQDIGVIGFETDAEIKPLVSVLGPSDAKNCGQYNEVYYVPLLEYLARVLLCEPHRVESMTVEAFGAMVLLANTYLHDHRCRGGKLSCADLHSTDYSQVMAFPEAVNRDADNKPVSVDVVCWTVEDAEVGNSDLIRNRFTIPSLALAEQSSAARKNLETWKKMIQAVEKYHDRVIVLNDQFGGSINIDDDNKLIEYAGWDESNAKDHQRYNGRRFNQWWLRDETIDDAAQYVADRLSSIERYSGLSARVVPLTRVACEPADVPATILALKQQEEDAYAAAAEQIRLAQAGASTSEAGSVNPSETGKDATPVNSSTSTPSGEQCLLLGTAASGCASEVGRKDSDGTCGCVEGEDGSTISMAQATTTSKRNWSVYAPAVAFVSVGSSTSKSSRVYNGGGGLSSSASLSPSSSENTATTEASAKCYPCKLTFVEDGCSNVGCAATPGGACKNVGCEGPGEDVVVTDEAEPKAETCNGKDDDGDGEVDNGDPASMGVGLSCSVTGGIGQCAVGQFVCQEGDLVCQGQDPVPESCDGLDNNCDGQTDNLTDGSCEQEQEPDEDLSSQPEICNGKDDNGDGFPDENNPGGGASCMVSSRSGAVLQKGKTACVDGALQCMAIEVPAAGQTDGTTTGAALQKNQIEAALNCAVRGTDVTPTWPVLFVLVALALAPRRRRSNR